MADRRVRKKMKAKTFVTRPLTGPPQIPTPKEEDPEASLERELSWCIQHLQLGIAAEKPDSKKVQDARKIIVVLQNPNAPLVKKRQLMRNTFGDYRKKMADEEKKFSANARKVTVVPTENMQPSTSTFYKRAHRSDKGSADGQSGSSCDHMNNASKSTFKFAPSHEPFQFNFNFKFNQTEKNISDISQDVSTMNIGDTNSSCQKSQPQMNYYKMETTGQNFSFNFANPETS